ncbi:MAG: Curli production assembly/transport component CsgG [Winogradskyella sp.]|uniref:Curli production assembly/transport component CsgG n=1 Tax=Winogradskyella sp. TaxID=1883156 RepID=UPI00385B0036
MIPKFSIILYALVIAFAFSNFGFSQNDDEQSEKSINRRYAFFNFRGSHAVDLGAGTAIVGADYEDPQFEAYFRIGYKHHLTSHLNLNVTFNKYNVAIKDISNEGFMSFDLNFEFLFSPYTKFSPYIFAGGGYNSSNDFESTATKAQGGLGLELIITEGVGLKLFGEYNYMFTDELDGLVAGDFNDVLLRAGLGLNIYFGGNKKKEALRRKMKTVINSNLIIPYN